MNGLIIEGVAGTGKSTIVSLLKESIELKRLRPVSAVIDEDRYSRLKNLMPLIKENQNSDCFLILERFHPTFFALMPESSLFESYDRYLNELNFGLVLLDLPDNEFENRSFFRPEMKSQNWSNGLIDWYGTQENAINAFSVSQQRRRDFLKLTKLKTLLINTKGREWQSYIDSIIKFIAE